MQGSCIKISIQITVQNTSGILKAHWVEDTYKRYQTNSSIIPKQDFPQKSISKCCLHYRSHTIASKSVHHYVYLCHPKIVHFALPRDIISSKTKTDILSDTYVKTEFPKGTWIESNKACKSIGGNLPIFNSKDEQDELISLIKMSEYRPPQMVILFIGLLGGKVGTELEFYSSPKRY